jgi:hypothetical protein
MNDPLVYKAYMFKFLYPPHTIERAYNLYTSGFSIIYIAEIMHIKPDTVEILLALYEEKHKYAQDSISAV